MGDRGTGGARDFHLGAIAQSERRESLGVRQGTPEAEAVCRDCLQIVTAETIKI